ncbi:hypothetical protein EIP91_004056 [Steccherinum ochraceum]|uniref:F-box domain-containing protein n=1 Tax=Steccherinum ochraceum TaxID=92696 RepID=A0A4R0RAM6_9APHY|nr:hypothetical protein EIP91_004056 [Steccherinum ochraceum]
MATISSLPNELLEHILQIAATDVSASNTPATVGRTCKTLHNIVQSSGIDVWHTSLRGINAMQSFLGLLESRELSHKKVYSLLVVVDHEQETGRARRQRARKYPLRHRLITSRNSLRLLPRPIPIPRPPESSPPTRARGPTPLRYDLTAPDDGQPCTAPHLQRLQLGHTHDLPKTFIDDELPAYLAAVAPQLTHVHLPIPPIVLKLFFDVNRFQFAVTPSLRAQANITGPPGSAHHFPPTLEQIVLRFRSPVTDAFKAERSVSFEIHDDILSMGDVARGRQHRMPVVVYPVEEQSMGGNLESGPVCRGLEKGDCWGRGGRGVDLTRVCGGVLRSASLTGIDCYDT